MFIWVALFFSAITYFHSDALIDFADEGFLWYGVLQVLQGQFPIRDFQSYDPGRYYWCAALMPLCGKGLIALRFACGVFQFVALSLGLCTIRKINRSPWFLILSGWILSVWMLISYRYFDSGMALMAIYFAARLAEKPSRRRYRAAGIFTGVVFFFGINHGIYVLGAMAVLMLFMAVRQKIPGFRSVSGFGVGLLIGLMPAAAMFLWVPGYAEVYGQSLLRLVWVIREGRAVTSNGVVWPWMLTWSGFSPDGIHRASVSFMYLFVMLYYFVLVSSVLVLKKIGSAMSAVWVASVFVGLFYLRHLFSHNDIAYLGEGILPVWVGLAAVMRSAEKPFLKRATDMCGVLFVVLSLGAAGLVHPITFKYMVNKDAMTWYPLNGEKLWLSKDDALYIEDVKELVSTHVRPEEPLLIAPLHTTFYVLLNKKSPTHELYFHLAPLPEMERQTIAQLEKNQVRWALVAHVRFDGRPESEMPTSHPMLWKYLQDHFEPVPARSLKTGYFLMKRKE